VPVFVVLSCVAACMYVLSSIIIIIIIIIIIHEFHRDASLEQNFRAYVTSVRLSNWIKTGDYYFLISLGV